MCLLFESLKVENRRFFNLEAHLQRMNASVNQLFKLRQVYSASDFRIPDDLTDDLYKCRIVYGTSLISVEFALYTIRKIKTLKIVEVNDLDYSHKFLERGVFDRLKVDYPGYDDFIIIKNGRVTDSTFSNLVFFDGRQWLTPETYLLNGTKRMALLNNKQLRAVHIDIRRLHEFSSVSFINAMLDPGNIVTETCNID